MKDGILGPGMPGSRIRGIATPSVGLSVLLTVEIFDRREDSQRDDEVEKQTRRGLRDEDRGVWRVLAVGSLCSGWRDLRKPADGMRSGIVFGPM
jgi:hypothetical protein